jgi:glycosyltransferase involved in cell wall biosynthesis
MRLCVLYDILPEANYRNDGNPLYVWASLKRMQEKGLLEVDHLAPKEDMNLFGKYDLTLDVDWGEDGLLPIIPYKLIDAPRPNAYWISDSHLGFDYRFEKSKKFDHVFCAQKQAVIDFKAKGVDAEWLPHAVESRAYQDMTTGFPAPFNYASKDYDVCFVGHVNSPNRVDFLDEMFGEFPNFFFGQRRFQDAARIYAKSKICLNIAMKEDLNMRCFEIMGSGSFLLTDWVPYIEELFEDGKHLVLYRSLDEAVDKAKYYLKHDLEREKIAQAGFEEVMAKHTIDQRVSRILEVCGKSLVAA